MDEYQKNMIEQLGQDIIKSLFEGGEGSGNFGHEGRPGEVGGSGEGGGGSSSKKKEPWEMTKEEFRNIVEPRVTELDLVKRYVNETGKKVNTKEDIVKVSQLYPKEWEEAQRLEKEKRRIYDAIPEKVKERFKMNELDISTHEHFIGQALRDGKPVPEEVLKDYPHLQKILKDKLNLQKKQTKTETLSSEILNQLFEGDLPGHAFHGNQWMGGLHQTLAGTAGHILRSQRGGVTSSLFKLARLSATARAVASGNPIKMARRAANILIGRKVVSKLYLKGRRKKKGWFGF